MLGRLAGERPGSRAVDGQKGGRSWFVPLVDGWWWGSGLPLGLYCSSESVGVNGVGAEVHQLVDPLSELFIDGSGTGIDVLKAGDGLFGTVGHIDDQLMVGAEGKADVGGDHGLLGVEVVALLAMYLR